jgi:hypothetical protein
MKRKVKWYTSDTLAKKPCDGICQINKLPLNASSEILRNRPYLRRPGMMLEVYAPGRI